MQSRFFLFGVLFVALAQAGWGQPVSLTSLIGAEYEASLRRGDLLTHVQDKTPLANLIPRDGQVKALVDRSIREMEPGFLVETLGLYRKASGTAWTEAERAGLYNQTLALSSLAGLQYYSSSRKQMRTFYETSAVVSGPEGATPLPDPRYVNPPVDLTIYARQRDLSFGDNVYRYNYHAWPNTLAFVQENLTAMHYGPIPAIGKNQLRSIVAICDAGEFLVVYAISMAKAAPIPGMQGRIGRSFITRAEAIFKWFSDRADRVFSKK
ncbi:MAG: hypothetical protein LBD31_06135 [Treponema sp.]|jgi:hypothetical protein|nr:hypothetical protein [Treponema sp.]